MTPRSGFPESSISLLSLLVVSPLRISAEKTSGLVGGRRVTGSQVRYELRGALLDRQKKMQPFEALLSPLQSSGSPLCESLADSGLSFSYFRVS